MKLQIKKLTDTAKIPTRGSDGAAGYDLYADSVENAATVYEQTGSVYVAGGSNLIVHTGIAMAIEQGYVGLIFARSGLACKKGLRPANCVGVIDEDYRGEIIVNLHNDIDYSKWINWDKALTIRDITEGFEEIFLGDRIAQIVFIRYEKADIEVVDNLDDTKRGAKGFGSTGDK